MYFAGMMGAYMVYSDIMSGTYTWQVREVHPQEIHQTYWCRHTQHTLYKQADSGLVIKNNVVAFCIVISTILAVMGLTEYKTHIKQLP